jgi:L-asparaginase II
MSAPILLSSWRGAVLEARLCGHVAVVRASGELVGAAGLADTVTTLRSCVKPLQALTFLRVAADALGATTAEIAIACASHNGEDVHVQTVRGLLQRAGLDEDALACGAQMPFDQAAAHTLIAGGLPPRAIHNNCSGKHAAMLAVCAVEGWPIQGYQQFDHPLQAAVREAMSEYLHVDLDTAPSGVDGCGIPTYGAPLSAIARAFAEAQRDPSFRRAQDAMALHPHLVAGAGRFDTALLAAHGGGVTSKVGGAAVWAGCLRPAGPGIAVKIESGVDSAPPPVALAVLARLGIAEGGWDESLEGFATPLIRNWAGDVVGEIRVEEGALDGVAPGLL